MLLLILGLILFLAPHSLRIVAEDWRGRQIAAFGEGAWKVVISLVSLVGLVLIVWGYGLVRADPVILWVPPVWTRHLAIPLVAIAFILVAAAYVPPGRIKAAVGHPMVLGVKVWALAHLIANGTLADLVLFGAILVWAIVDYAGSRRRDRAAGRVHLAGPARNDGIAVAVGLAIWAAFLFGLHQWLFGVAPLG
jgi:uncharacterized membrane protein